MNRGVLGTHVHAKDTQRRNLDPVVFEQVGYLRLSTIYQRYFPDSLDGPSCSVFIGGERHSVHHIGTGLVLQGPGNPSGGHGLAFGTSCPRRSIRPASQPLTTGAVIVDESRLISPRPNWNIFNVKRKNHSDKFWRRNAQKFLLKSN